MKTVFVMLLLAACAAPRPVENPLLVWSEPGLVEGVTAALDDINQEMGCGLLQPATREASADIRIRNAGCPALHHGGCAFHTSRGAAIHVAHPGNTTRIYLIILHELGHVFGLKHAAPVRAPDPWIPEKVPSFVSIMVPNVADHYPRLALGQSLPMFTMADRAALRRLCQ